MFCGEVNSSVEVRGETRVVAHDGAVHLWRVRQFLLVDEVGNVLAGW